jgi:hypothetical protein
MGVSPARAQEVDFTLHHLEVELGYLIWSGSKHAKLACLLPFTENAVNPFFPGDCVAYTLHCSLWGKHSHNTLRCMSPRMTECCLRSGCWPCGMPEPAPEFACELTG